MDYSMPGSPVLYCLLEIAQIHVHWVDDAIQPSHPLLLPTPFALDLSQHQEWTLNRKLLFGLKGDQPLNPTPSSCLSLTLPGLLQEGKHSRVVGTRQWVTGEHSTRHISERATGQDQVELSHHSNLSLLWCQPPPSKERTSRVREAWVESHLPKPSRPGKLMNLAGGLRSPWRWSVD